MKRRRFFLNLARIGLGIAAPAIWLARAVPKGIVLALPTPRYPGRLKSLKASEVNKPARWLG